MLLFKHLDSLLNGSELVGDDSDEAVLYSPRELLRPGRYERSIGPFGITLFVPIVPIALDGDIAAPNGLEDVLVMARRHSRNVVTVKNKRLLTNKSLIMRRRVRTTGGKLPKNETHEKSSRKTGVGNAVLLSQET